MGATPSRSKARGHSGAKPSDLYPIETPYYFGSPPSAPKQLSFKLEESIPDSKIGLCFQLVLETQTTFQILLQFSRLCRLFYRVAWEDKFWAKLPFDYMTNQTPKKIQYCQHSASVFFPDSWKPYVNQHYALLPSSPYSDSLKIIVMGSGGVGKSALTVQKVQGIFVEKYDPTIEDCFRPSVMLHGRHVSMEILDTAGTDQFTAMRDLYLKNGQGFLVLYSLTAKSSFSDLEDIISLIRRINDLDLNMEKPILVVGNKLDLKDQRVVDFESGLKFAQEQNVAFIETSAKANVNVIRAFNVIAELALLRRARLEGHRKNHKKRKD